MDLKEIKEQSLSKLTSRELYNRFEHEFIQVNDGKLQGDCPVHTSNSKTSFVVYPNKKFHCTGCQFGGDIIDYIYSSKIGFKDWNKCPNDKFPEIIKELANLADIETPKYNSHNSTEEKYQYLKDKIRQQILEATYEFCMNQLWSNTPEANNALIYQRNRCFIDESIKALGIGYYSNSLDLWKHLKCKFKETDIKFVKVCNPKYNNYLTYPWLDEKSNPLTIYFRYPSKELPQNINSKTLALSGEGSKSVPFCLNKALANNHLETLIVFEGINDALVLQSHGFTNAISPVAASLSNDQLDLLQKLEIKRVILVPDNDTGGIQGTKRNIIQLFNRGIQPFVIARIPDVKDINDLFINLGGIKATETFNKLIEEPKHGLTWFIDEFIAPLNNGTYSSKLAMLDKAEIIKSTLTNTESMYFHFYFVEKLKLLLGF